MDVSDLFRSPMIEYQNFLRRRYYLYRHDVTLHDYFHVLDFNSLYGQNGGRSNRSSINPLAVWSFRAADKASRV